MGAITPALGAIGGVVSLGTSIAAKRAEDKARRQKINLDREKIKQDQASFEDDRRDRLKRAAASQRARFGASGVSMAGSGSAVLLGLSEQTDEEIDRRASLNRLKQNALDSDSRVNTTRSLLDAASLFERIR